MKESTIGVKSVMTATTCRCVDLNKLSEEKRIALLEQQVAQMSAIIERMKSRKRPASTAENCNKDGIPIGTVCYGATEKSPLFLYYLEVEEDGYAVSGEKYASLSAAAEAVSLVRRSGWTFWKVWGDGRSLKEVYRS